MLSTHPAEGNTIAHLAITALLFCNLGRWFAIAPHPDMIYPIARREIIPQQIQQQSRKNK